jgi:hypothetical protein
MADKTNVQGCVILFGALFTQNTENEEIDLDMLRSVGSFDASRLLPIIARLSNTYLETNADHSLEVHHL